MEILYSNITDFLKNSSEILNYKFVQALIDILPTGVVIANSEGDIVYTNKEALSIFCQVETGEDGKDNKKSFEYELYRLDGSIIAPNGKFFYNTIKEGIKTRDTQVLIRFDNGKEKIVSVSSTPILDNDDSIKGALAVFHDITDNKTYERKLLEDITESKRIEGAFKDSEDRFRNVFENTASGMALVSLEGHYFLVNKALCNILGYSEEELSNMTLFEMTHPDDIQKELQMIHQLINGEIKNYQFEKRYVHKNGSIIWVLLTRSLVKDTNGRPFYFIGQIQDISLQKKAQEDLKQAILAAENAREQAEEARIKAELLSRIDYLTGILNRRAFIERLLEEANRLKRKEAKLTLILTDIDYFKKVNDSYGHKVGDLVLQAFSSCLDNMCRPYDFIGRYGGEEFIICLPEIDMEQGKEIAERMRIAVQELKISIPDTNKDINITASFGVATAQIKRVRYAEKLIEYADEAMYKAKQQGRNRVIAVSHNFDSYSL